jgi:hypothetical protein
MATLTIRNLDDSTKAQLRLQAARHGRSMEEEARARPCLVRRRNPLWREWGTVSRPISPGWRGWSLIFPFAAAKPTRRTLLRGAGDRV